MTVRADAPHGWRPTASAYAAALAWGIVTLILVLPWDPDSLVYALLQVVSIAAIAVQLPAAWRLASVAHPHWLGIAAIGVMSVAALAATAAFVTLGVDARSDGPLVQYALILASTASLVVLVGAAFRAASPERRGLVVLGLGAAALALLGAYSYVRPGGAGPLIIVGYVLIVIGWIRVANAWRRASRTP